MRLVKDFIGGTLGLPLAINETTLTLTPQQVAVMPQPAVGDFFALVLTLGEGENEIVHVTNNPGTGVLTIVRAREGTAARTWWEGTAYRLGITAATFNEVINAREEADEVIEDLALGSASVIRQAANASQVVLDNFDAIALAAKWANNDRDDYPDPVNHPGRQSARTYAEDALLSQTATAVLAAQVERLFLGVYIDDTAAAAARPLAQVGSVYFNTSTEKFRRVVSISPIVFSGGTLELDDTDDLPEGAVNFYFTNGRVLAVTDPLYLEKSDNLSDLDNVADARDNLGLGALALLGSVNNGNWSGTDLAIENGGTGASTAAGARTNLELGSLAQQNAGSVNITGGAIAGITDLAIADGGTGASTAAGARSNLELGALATLNAVNNGNWSGADLAVANGGTGASTAAGARTNLELGALAVLNNINNSNWSGTPLAVANGGTGGNSQASARTGLGLGALAVLNTINNGNWSGAALSVANGGTGAASAAAALANLGGLGVQAQSLGSPGYVHLTNGLKIQWGQAAISANGNTVVPYPLAFSSFSVAVCSGADGGSSSGASENYPATIATSTTSFTVRNVYDSTVQTWWIAVGV